MHREVLSLSIAFPPLFSPHGRACLSSKTKGRESWSALCFLPGLLRAAESTRNISIAMIRCRKISLPSLIMTSRHGRSPSEAWKGCVGPMIGSTDELNFNPSLLIMSEKGAIYRSSTRFRSKAAEAKSSLESEPWGVPWDSETQKAT
jgi:hypothetical protein